ncbi:tyrosine-type recombinase/integrase [Falsiroseomonas sp. HW251]|uniref:tyrosine-type recombinase/integrase n=1 Tax=Falsiroseomonas sp. HW251 TaxID=3390998 RepID=UPI003D310147
MRSNDTTRFVHWKRSGDGKVRPAYRRTVPGGEFRVPLPADVDPESEEFRRAWDAADRLYHLQRTLPGVSRVVNPGTVDEALDMELRSPEHFVRAPSSKRQYEGHIERFRREFGHVMMKGITWQWVQDHKKKWANAGQQNQWNITRKVMRLVTDRFIKSCESEPRRRKLAPLSNPWGRTPKFRIETEKAERQNRPWPLDVIVRVLRGATPEFRNLLLIYLLTAQRGQDVLRFTRDPVTYNKAAGVLIFTQGKTKKAMRVPVAPQLAELLAPEGEALLRTPRGKLWKLENAQETLRTLLTNLGLPRYTLHGLRSTAVAALGEEGFAEIAIMALTGHSDARSIRIYLEGFDQQRAASPVVAALSAKIETALRQASLGANGGRVAGVTGRAAARLGIAERARVRRKKLRGENSA